MRSLLAGMLQSGILTESSSPWAALIVMVRKKDRSWRFCVVYRKLNAVTHKDDADLDDPGKMVLYLGPRQ